MKKLLLLLALISTTAFSQCIIDGTEMKGNGAKSPIYKACDVVVQSLTNGMVESSGDSLKTAVPGVHYSTPATVNDTLTKYVKKRTGNVLFDFYGTDNLDVTNDNGGYAKAQLGLSNGGAFLGYGNNYIDFSTADNYLHIYAHGATNFHAGLSTLGITANRLYTFPNASGRWVLEDNTADITNKTYNGVTLTGSSTPSLAVTGTASIAGSNNGDQTITLTGDIAGSGTGSFATTIGAGKVTNSMLSGSIAYSKLSLTNSLVSGDIVSLVWSKITSTPTTLSGYGITDAQPLTTNGTHWASIDTSAKANVNAQNITKTGAGSTYVMQGSPTLTTPNIGAATATSINKVAITAPATSATLTLADGSTLATSGANSVTITTTGTTNVTLPTSGTLRSKEGMVTNPIYFTDFISANANAHSPYLGQAVSSGTAGLSTANYSASTSGIVRLVSSTTTDSGYRIGGGNTFLVIKGGEIFRAAVAVVGFTNNTIRIGFHGCSTVADAINGIYFEITSSAIVFKTSQLSTRTTSSTVYTATANTFYKFEILVNSNATSVTGNIYDVTGVTLLGTATITTNIPSTTSNLTNVQVIGTNSTSTATDICDVDYLYSEFTVTR